MKRTYNPVKVKKSNAKRTYNKAKESEPVKVIEKKESLKPKLKDKKKDK